MNPHDEKDPRLPKEAEELLEDWPIPERDEADWESLAVQIDAKINHTPIGSTDDALLMAPLPEGAAEERVERRSHPRVKRPSDGGLAALAKATMLVRDETQRTELAQATLDVARRARRGSRPRPPRAIVQAEHTEPVEAQAKERPNRAAWISMAFGVVGMAAAVVMYFSTRQHERLTAAPTLPAGTPIARTEAEAKATVAVTEADAVAPALPVEQVPLAEPEKSTVAAMPRRTVVSKPAAAPKTTKPSEKAQAPAPLAAPGPSEAGMMMADGRAGIADRPSPGAIQAAVGSVMGAARACTAGLTGASRAAVTFGSDGQVRSVTVSGPAQGTGAEACIQTALGRARVQPFARSSYTVKLSVRPE